MQMTVGVGVTGLQQAWRARGQERAPVGKCPLSQLVPLSSVLCCARCVGAALCCACAALRSLAGAAAESGGFKHLLSLFLHPHPLHEGLFNFG
jgi:hypothetical protein